jgi:LCP family protein required for cell wall assembly
VPKHKTPKNWKKIIKRSVVLVLVLALLSGGWIGWSFYRSFAKITHDNNPLGLLGIFYHTPLKNQSGRVNILVAGDSADDPGHQGANLTDSIMILSLDTKNHTAFLLSIPRDTWVYIPSMGYQKINASNDVTNFHQAGYPNGGMGQLEELINQYFGIPIDYYALVNYSAFKDTVNALGGIRVDIQSPDPRGLYDAYTHLDLPNGSVTLNGQTALDLARARGDEAAGDISYGFPNSDFDRTEHQRQMAIAIKEKATSIGFLSNPLKVARFINAIGNNVQTDLKLNDVESLYSDTKGINNSNIKSYGLNNINGQNLLTGYYSTDGQDALIPAAGFNNFTQIQSVVQQLMSTTSNTSKST